MAGAAGVDPILAGAAVFLGAATIAVPVFKRLGLGSVLGYLAAGIVIGPSTFGLVSDLETAAHFGEFGVVLLLFVIGLELRPTRLWRLRLEIFGLGLAQVVLTAALLAVTLYLVSPLTWSPSIAIGAALALSSTAFAVQILRDRGEFTTSYGDRAFSILLFQDLAIVPLLALVAFLAPLTGDGEASPWWWQVLMALGAVTVVILFGRYGLKPLFRAIALSHTEEIFAAAALLVVVLAAALMQVAGLSMALGAFLAGVLLAESEYRHQVEADIEPFRSLFLGLFFMSVGMTVKWSVVLEWFWVILLGAVILYIGKAAFLLTLTRLAQSTWEDAIRIAALLGQGGEFGFVILALGSSGGLWATEFGGVITSVIVLTMIMTPAAVMVADRIVRSHGREAAPQEGETAATSHPVIIAGFGRFGQIVARIMALRGYEIVLIDKDPERIRIAETFGNKVFYGDLRRSDLLKLAGAREAKAIFLCGDDKDAVAKALQKLRARLPNTPIFCRASDRFEQTRLEKLGATGVMREMYESAIALAGDALTKLGEASIAEETIEEFRRRDIHLLHLQEEHGAHGGLKKMREQFSLEEDKKASVSGAPS
ncbi:MAG: monovalent cation:proton antiporter-2 (CPA2) family protein [Pseudomonadota bacterium]